MLRDVKHAWRGIRRSPALSAVVIVSIAIGIGANATVFSWIQARLFNPVPGAVRAGDLLLLEPIGENGSYPGLSWLEYRDIREGISSATEIVAFRMLPLNVGVTDWTERRAAMLVSANYFSGLGVTPAAGRLITPDDEGRERPIVVISHEYWQSRFAGSLAVVGQTLRVNDRQLTIVGVAPAGFRGSVMGLVFDLWVPADLAPQLIEGTRELTNRGQRGYSAIARPAPGASRADLERQFDAVMSELSRAYPATNATLRGQTLEFWQSPRGPQRFMMAALVLLQGILLLMLLAVCGNTANLLLARASVRRREIAVRLALGAGRTRVMWLVLAESLMLALTGAVVGALLAVWGTEALRAVPMPSPAGFTVRFDTGVDGLTMLVALGLGVVSGLAFGLPPAVQLARNAPNTVLRTGASPAGRSRLRDILMVVEAAVAIVVLVAAAIFVKNFNDTQSADPGFHQDGIILATYDLRGSRASVDAAESVAFASRLLDGVRRLPGVQSAAIAASVPLDIHGIGSRSFTLEGRARTDGLYDQAVANTVTDDYFTAMAIPVLAGRDFVHLADRVAPPQVIVNQTFVRAFLPDAEPIGRRLASGGVTYVISGVVRDSLYNSFGEPPTPAMYFSFRDRPLSSGELHVRAQAGDGTSLVPEVREILRGLDPALPLYNVRTLEEHVDRNLIFRRIPARMFVVLGPLLLVLAAIGIYAVVAYTVSQRTSEIGMRLALGATSRRVVAEIVLETMRVVTAGAAAGWVVAWLIARQAAATSMPVVVLAAVPLVLLAVATLACWIPASRASRLDPMSALRE